MQPRLIEATQADEGSSSTHSLLLFAFSYKLIPRTLKEQSKQCALTTNPLYRSQNTELYSQVKDQIKD